MVITCRCKVLYQPYHNLQMHMVSVSCASMIAAGIQRSIHAGSVCMISCFSIRMEAWQCMRSRCPVHGKPITTAYSVRRKLLHRAVQSLRWYKNLLKHADNHAIEVLKAQYLSWVKATSLSSFSTIPADVHMHVVTITIIGYRLCTNWCWEQ